MTVILKLDLDMVKMYLHTKNEVSMSSSSKVIVWTDRNTDRQTYRHTDRHDWKHYLPAYMGGKNWTRAGISSPHLHPVWWFEPTPHFRAQVKLFYNYYKCLENVSHLINCISFATNIFNIFESIIENFRKFLSEEKVEGKKVYVSWGLKC